jgi:hypothetical protein
MAKREPKEDAIVKLDPRGQLSIRLDGQDFTLRPSVEAILEAESGTGLSLFDLASLAANSRMRLDQMGTVVASFMRAQGKANPEDPLKTSYLGANAETLTELIMEAGIPRIMGGLTVLLAGALNGGYTASGEPKAAGTK